MYCINQYIYRERGIPGYHTENMSYIYIYLSAPCYWSIGQYQSQYLWILWIQVPGTTPSAQQWKDQSLQHSFTFVHSILYIISTKDSMTDNCPVQICHQCLLLSEACHLANGSRSAMFSFMGCWLGCSGRFAPRLSKVGDVCLDYCVHAYQSLPDTVATYLSPGWAGRVKKRNQLWWDPPWHLRK